MVIEFEGEIIEKVYETPSVFTFKVDVKNNNFEYLAGHYIGIDLRNNLSEYQMIKAFSLASSPTEPYLLIASKKGESPFKQKLESLNVGDKIKLKGPYGRFLFQDDLSKNAVFIAGGIGITPFRGIIKYITDKKLNVNVELIYSNRTNDEIAFYKELEEISKSNKNIKIIYTLTRENNNNWNGNKGRIDAKLIKENVKDINNSIFYVCGSPSMVEDMIDYLRNLGIKEENLRYEKFTGYK